MPIERLPSRGDNRPQVMPTAEGWTQQLGPDGRPSLQFESPRGAKPPVHWADLSVAEREATVVELGLPKFRAKQLSTHYFTHYTSDPAHMTDLPAETRADIVAATLPPLLTEVRRRPRRIGSDALSEPHHALCLVAGGLRNELSVLCDGSGWAHA
jgi:23S rRNA (adenine2503-C2)-methyltransferase